MTVRVVCGLTGRLERVVETEGRWYCDGCGRRVRRPIELSAGAVA